MSLMGSPQSQSIVSQAKLIIPCTALTSTEHVPTSPFTPNNPVWDGEAEGVIPFGGGMPREAVAFW